MTAKKTTANDLRREMHVLEKQASQFRRQMNAAEEAVDKRRDALALLLAEFKPGEPVKHGGKRYVIERVSMSRWQTEEKVYYVGREIRKDGKPGLRVRRLSQYGQTIERATV